MAKQNTIVIKSFRITAENFKIIKEIADELCFSQTDVIRLMLNRAVQQIKFDKVRAGGYKNLTFSLEKIK